MDLFKVTRMFVVVKGYNGLIHDSQGVENNSDLVGKIHVPQTKIVSTQVQLLVSLM